MRRTRAELSAILMKAARGAGLPLALAEDLYASAPYFTAEDLAEIAEDICKGGASLKALLPDLDAVACGATMALPVYAPAFAAARGWRLENGRKIAGDPPAPGGPLDVSAAIWDALEIFAARTYVPETETSRAQGAGAGAIDND